MKIEIRKSDSFYPTLKSWWVEHDFPEIVKEVLPQDVIVVVKEHTAIYAAAFYHTDSALCWIAFPTSNPFASKKAKKGGLEALISAAEEYAKECGYKVIFTTSGTKAIENVLVDSDFSLGDVKVNQYLKGI